MREICIHEAGHAVMARAVGVLISHIEITPDENSLGRCHTVASRFNKLSQTDWAAVFYAGFVAQRRVNPNCRLHSLDLENFNTCLKGASPAMREAVIARVEATIAARWDEVEHLADELERCNGLYSLELEKLGYWWPAPPVRDSALWRSLTG